MSYILEYNQDGENYYEVNAQGVGPERHGKMKAQSFKYLVKSKSSDEAKDRVIRYLTLLDGTERSHQLAEYYNCAFSDVKITEVNKADVFNVIKDVSEKEDTKYWLLKTYKASVRLLFKDIHKPETAPPYSYKATLIIYAKNFDDAYSMLKEYPRSIKVVYDIEAEIKEANIQSITGYTREYIE